MDILLKINNIIFSKIFIGSLFPVIVILIIFFIIDYKKVKKSSQFYFILIVAAVVLLIRILFAIHGDKISFNIEARRFYPLIFPVIILAVFGFSGLINLTQSIFLKIGKYFYMLRQINKKQIAIIWILIIGISCIGKGLSPPSYKAYIHEPGKIIKSNTSKDKKSLLIYDNLPHSRRTVYYSHADRNIASNDVLNVNKPEYFYDALNVLHKKGYKTYVFVDNSNDQFKNVFIDKGVEFKLKLLKQWKRGQYTLYEYNDTNISPVIDTDKLEATRLQKTQR